MYGNKGTKKCSRCRQLKARVLPLWKCQSNCQCEYFDPNKDCARCQIRGIPCGPKILTSDILATRSQSLRVIPYPSHLKTNHSDRDASRSQTPIQSPQRPISDTGWSLDEPLLPQIFRQFNSDPATKFIILDKLNEELRQIEVSGIWSPSNPHQTPSHPPSNSPRATRPDPITPSYDLHRQYPFVHYQRPGQIFPVPISSFNVLQSAGMGDDGSNRHSSTLTTLADVAAQRNSAEELEPDSFSRRRGSY